MKVALLHADPQEALRLQRWLVEAGADVLVISDVSEVAPGTDLVVMQGEMMQPASTLAVHPYVFNMEAREITVHGRPVPLTAMEFELAALLFRRFGEALSRVEMAERVWKRVSLEDSRTLDAHMSKLRRKLELTPANGVRLVSLYGFGYCLQRAGPAPLRAATRHSRSTSQGNLRAPAGE